MLEQQEIKEFSEILKAQFERGPIKRQLRVLVVEDDFSMHPMWESIIRSVDKSAIIRSAHTEEGAEQLIEKQRLLGEDFDLVVSDIFLDGEKNGVDLWRKYGKQQTLFLFTSVIGKQEFAEMIGKDEDEFPLLLQKPVRSLRSAEVLRTLLNFRDFFTDKTRTRKKQGKGDN